MNDEYVAALKVTAIKIHEFHTARIVYALGYRLLALQLHRQHPTPFDKPHVADGDIPDIFEAVTESLVESIPIALGDTYTGYCELRETRDGERAQSGTNLQCAPRHINQDAKLLEAC